MEPAAVERVAAEPPAACEAGRDLHTGGHPASGPKVVPIYLDVPVKKVMERYPGVGAVLSEFGVSCVECSLGSCPLRDCPLREIVSIHDLSPEQEEALLERLSVIFYPNRPIRLPSSARNGGTGAALGLKQSTGRAVTARGSQAVSAGGGQAVTPSYSPPIRQLVQEHVLIMRWVSLVPRLLRVMNLSRSEDRNVVRLGIDFIRSYADHFHHAKEEDTLFKLFDESKDIIQVMLSDHETARAYVRAAEAALTARDSQAVTDHLQAYADLLREHIGKENNVLYPWMDRQLTMAQVGKMFRRFAEVDSRADAGTMNPSEPPIGSFRQDEAKSPEAAQSRELQGPLGSQFTQRYTQLITHIERFVARREESEGGI